MPKPEPGRDLSAYAALALVGELGFAVAIPIVVAVIGGKYLDDWLHARGIVLAGSILFGLASGFYSAYRMVEKVMNWKR